MKIALLKPHTHAGRDYEPGHEIDVDEDTGAWLVAIKSAEPSAPKPAAKPGKTKE